MYRLIGCVLLYGTLTTGLPFPFPGVPVVPPTPVIPTPFPFVPGSTPIVPGAIPYAGRPVVPTAIPFAPGAAPIVPGVGNPYYNYAGAPAIPILSYSNEHGLDGTYAFSFSTADGKQAQESGYLKDAYIDNTGNPQGTQVVQGSYAYVSPDGTPIQVSYVADENGFRPSGVHIPADGKAVAPIVPVVDRVNKPIFDPTYNRYDPYLNRNRYNTFGQYNNRNYDPRYPYDPTKINPYYNNNYNPYQIRTKNFNQEAKKDSA
ncbi:endocuticle structural glycoprotein SgAbd-1-like [Helicoverpa armigera]|uniref:endocuticle structural glycoprotein SgAbd-1-like n=1 Tax=Helicoverpa armigera TaxID=29058 RepID=UPI003082F2BE